MDYDEEAAPVIPVATNNEIFPWNNVRLPDSVQPLRYRIHIHPNLTTFIVKVSLLASIGVVTVAGIDVLHVYRRKT